MDTELARAWLLAAADAIEADRDRLTRLDTEIGDGDHGTNLHRGFTAVRDVLDDAESPGAVLVKVGTTLISRVGGASGPLYGTVFRTAGNQLDTDPAGVAEFAAALGAGRDAVCRLGAARVGDKTMVDALSPTVDALTAADPAAGLASAARSAAEAAKKGAESTVALRARKGRASYLGARSEGHLDPGVASTSLIIATLADVADR